MRLAHVLEFGFHMAQFGSLTFKLRLRLLYVAEMALQAVAHFVQLAAGELRSAELVRAYLDRIAAIDSAGPRLRSVIELNLIATFNLNRLQAWHMSRNEPLDGERGVIVNTSSIAAFEGQVGQVAYTAAKAGIAGMALTMARELGSLGIRVMAIAPSLFATGITSGIPEEMASALTRDAAYPRRMGRPEEYASLAVAIVENQMLNGGTIRLDGGQRFAPK